MRKGEKLCYKLARPDGWDFYTGNTINYRDNIGKVVSPPIRNGNTEPKLCSNSVIHASVNPNDCFIGANIPCSAYRVKGIPACGNKEKYGFSELVILEEIKDLDTLFKWRYSEAALPLHPLKLPKCKPNEDDIKLLKDWASVGDSVWDSVRASVGDSVRASVWDSVGDSVGDSVWDSVWDSVRASVGASVRDSVGDSVGASVWASVGASVWASVGAYIGYIFFPVVTKWHYTYSPPNVYPYMASVDLWKRGLVPTFDGKIWRLHSGDKANIVYESSK